MFLFNIFDYFLDTSRNFYDMKLEKLCNLSLQLQKTLLSE